MDERDLRLRWLQQIPVFALRQVVTGLIGGEGMEEVMRERFRTILNVQPRNLPGAVQRLNREHLTRLIDACPEVSNDQIQGLFEEYRYGTNPSFYIYLFDVQLLQREALKGFRQRFEAELEAFNAPREEGLPRLRRLALNDLGALPERPEIIEGNYRFQKRLDYIDAEQNAVSTYETVYGFFWLNAAEGYVIIHATTTRVLKALKRAIQQGADIYLTPLVISKRLKNALPFLLQESLRSGRLHDPDPGPDRFRWLTISDDALYEKGYEDWEKRYPEVRSARYREVVAGEKETSLTVRCDRGALSLAGKLMASQFRAWCLKRLGQIIGVLHQFQADPPAYVRTRRLDGAPEMAKFSAIQRRLVLEIISALLTLKQASHLGYQALHTPPLALAAGLGRFVRVQIPLECPEPECKGEEGYLACPTCDATVFTLTRQEEAWHVECRAHRRKRWSCALPLEGVCEREHPFTLEADDLAERVELLPSKELSSIIATVINDRLPGYSFDPEREGFIVRGPNLLYYPDKGGMPDSEQAHVTNFYKVVQHIEAMEGGEVVGVRVS